MIYLITASLIWCFSFGLIGKFLSDLPPAWIATVRLLLAFIVFAPFIKRTKPLTAVRLTATGAIQFGLMYLAYMHSFQFLKSHEVALFTIFTPLYVSLINDLQNRKVSTKNLFAAALSVTGAGIILWKNKDFTGSLTGFALVQASNFLFALGQMLYRTLSRQDLKKNQSHNDRNIISWLYMGGFLVILPLALHDMHMKLPRPNLNQYAVIIYLGIVASGIAFFLWNKGCRQVKAGTLAVMNNLKIPTAVVVSLLIFREHANFVALISGSMLIGAAIWVATLRQKKDSSKMREC